MTTITNRSEYLEFVRAWKTEYAALSQAIREKKTTMKTQQRLNSPTAGMEQCRREILRWKATAMLAARAEAKLAAQERYLAEKEAA